VARFKRIFDVNRFGAALSGDGLYEYGRMGKADPFGGQVVNEAEVIIPYKWALYYARMVEGQNFV